ncbi:MAG: Xaa-Pro peptidase family protein [Candidatus Thorarchaeota archaeon]|nr:Xaa-Pro peptidase family protein [Candidatus Thorarchaeota archaeon]
MASIEIEKSTQACEILKEMNLDAWMVWVRETSQMADPVLELVLGSDLVWQSALLFTKEGEKIAIIGSLDADGIRPKNIFDRISTYDHSVSEILVKELDGINPQKLAVNFSRNDVSADGLTVGMYRILQDYLKETPYIDRLVSAESFIAKLRGRKTSAELSRIQRAVDITEEIFDAIALELKVGMTELEIHNRMHQMMDERNVGNAWNEDHNPAINAGPNKEFGHSGPTENRTKEGQLLHFDFGVKWDGYCSDIQRMFFFGKPEEVPTEVTHAFEAVRDTIQTCAEFMRSGVTGNQVDSIARDFVKERGYEEFRHALGHQVGRLAHDGGTLLGPYWEKYGESPSGILEPGNVFTLELYVTTKEYGQVSLEEDVVVTKDGCKFLSHPQKSINCVQ